jgi:acylphosphatase
MIQAVRLEVIGTVVGVFFRATTEQKAKRLNLTGWVRNVYDKPEIFGENGGVEVVVQGDENKIKKFIEEVKNGPGQVKEVKEYPHKVDLFMKTFSIRT